MVDSITGVVTFGLNLSFALVSLAQTIGAAPKRVNRVGEEPGIEELRNDLRESKSNLLLLLSVATLAHAEKLSLMYGLPLCNAC